MKARELIAELKHRNHSQVHHACTLGTFRSYCALGAYRSRAAVRGAGLLLTPQVSDEDDERLGIFDHLFLNIYDQHADVHRGRSVTGLNKYGPLLMVLDVEALSMYAGEVMGYATEITSAAYSSAVHDVVTLEDFRRNTFSDPSPAGTSDAPSRRKGTPGPNMCVHCKEENGGIPFAPYLIEVIVDAFPSRLQSLQQKVMVEVRQLVAEYTPGTKVTQRQCVQGCDCEYGYGTVLSDEDIRRFVYETNTHVYPRWLRRPRQRW
ncbi:MAG TPA: hypothetical protein VFK13_01205 [Gemmatimonadaceae bacterium]|nr:hypothetical protein [Gemmatimonadaceae bacterium]